MSINYLDTVTMYYSCCSDIRNLFMTHWIWDNNNKDINLHCFCIKTDNAFIRFFHSMYGYRRLYMTFSLPKLYHNSKRNTYNVTDYDNATFMNIVEDELAKVMDISQLPTTLADWQPSRIDLFRMRTIKPADRLEYHHGYSRLIYRGVRTSSYKNTNYLPSSLHGKHSCILLREYDKTVEEQEKQLLLYGYLPASIEVEHELLMQEMDIPDHLYRYEFSLRRNAIIKFCNRYLQAVNMQTIMSEQFQKHILNELVISRGLHFNILNKRQYRQIVSFVFHWKQTQDNALKLAESIRNRKSIPLKKHQQYRIQHELNSYFISTATTNFVTIKGLELL